MVITLTHGALDNWFTITDEHGHRINGADIEGDREEWTRVADALDIGESVSFKRCAARRTDQGWELSSPRNSVSPTRISATEGARLAVEIRRVLDATPVDEGGPSEDPEVA